MFDSSIFVKKCGPWKVLGNLSGSLYTGVWLFSKEYVN